MDARRTRRTHGSAPVDGHEFEIWWDANGTSTVTSMSPLVSSVTRKSTGGGVEFYRVTLADTTPLATYHAANAWIENLTSTALMATVLDSANASSGGTRTESTDIDIGVYNIAGTAYTNQVAAGQRIGCKVVIGYGEDS